MKTIKYTCRKCKEDVQEINTNEYNYCHKCVQPLSKEELKSLGYQEFSSSEYMVAEMISGKYKIVTLGTTYFDDVSEELGFWEPYSKNWIALRNCYRMIKFKSDTEFVRFIKEHRNVMDVEWFFEIFGENV